MKKFIQDVDKRSNIIPHSLISTCLLHELPDAVFLIDPESSNILYANKVAYESVGLTETEVINHSVMSLQEAVINQPQWCEIAEVIRQSKEPYVFLGRHQRKDGSCFPVEVRTSNLYYEGKHFFLSVARDVTFRQVIDNEMEAHKHSLWYALNEASDGLWEWNIEQDTLYVSPKLKQMRGYGPEEDASKVDFWISGIHPDDKNRVLAVMQEHLQGRTDKFEAKYRLRNRAGHFIWVNDKGKVSKRDAKGNPTIVAGMVQNVTDQVALQERLENQAARDELTGAFNRRICHEILEQQITTSRINGESFAVVLIDIDYFKSINDQYGHQVGDDVLKAFVNKVEEHLREGDILFRWGGEEFLLLLPRLEESKQYRVADKVRKTIEDNRIVLSDKTEISLTVSVGVSTYPFHGSTRNQLIEKADIAMYRAKANGRNRVELFSE
ncbi:MAG: diguanylate cyclase [Gammaproteobacteria bacterium]|jgi:diguanylate cyclase (GGDEF)-like protein/PAS domain S-box-containing protein|nr:MAG: diguanylate cyclase [Gammaproteobacteria bacterium]PHR84434.1 MAG: diguanylate cyclase [Colwellia sp.]